MRSPAGRRGLAGTLPLKFYKGGARRVDPNVLDKTSYSRLVCRAFKILGHVLRRSEIYQWFELHTNKPTGNPKWKSRLEKILSKLPRVASVADAKVSQMSLLICDSCSEDGLSCEGEDCGAEWAKHEDEILLEKVNLSRYCNTSVPRITGRTEIAVLHRWMYLERRKHQRHLCDN